MTQTREHGPTAGPTGPPVGLDSDQLEAVRAGVTVLTAWALAEDDPVDTLLAACRREHAEVLAIGLASVARLLALELGVASGRREDEVIRDLWCTARGEPRPARSEQRHVTLP